MALEDLTGTKYVSDLERTNPEGAVDLGLHWDDHTRGIKNVLRKTFPNFTGALDLTTTEINVLKGISLTLPVARINLLEGISSSLTVNEVNLMVGQTDSPWTSENDGYPSFLDMDMLKGVNVEFELGGNQQGVGDTWEFNWDSTDKILDIKNY